MRERWGSLAAVIALLIAVPAAAAPGVYVIADVAVDETAASARDARALAIDAATAEAWRRLARRLVLPGGTAPEPGAERLERLVHSLEIAEERIAARRYRALVTVRFHGPRVRGLLDDAGLDHAVTPAPVLLVLPIGREGEAVSLWDDAGPWFRAWRGAMEGRRLIDVVVPFGDLEDLRAIDAAAALAGDREAMTRAMTRYRADGTLVALATDTGAAIDLEIVWHDGAGSRAVPVLADGAAGARAPEDAGRWTRAVDLVRRSVDAWWRAASVVPSGPESELIVDLPIAGLADWVNTRRLLDRPASLLEARPLVISTGSVRLLLRYVGGLDRLRAGLAVAGLQLRPRGDGWAMSPP